MTKYSPARGGQTGMDATSLSFELFSICVKIYKLLLEATDLPKHSRHLHLRLQIERDKLVDWAVLANLSEDERTLNSSLHLNQHKINGALQEIRLVLLDLTKLSGRYELDEWTRTNSGRASSDSSRSSHSKLNSSLQMKAIAFAESTRTFPRQLRWASIDKKEFEMLLARLTALNQNMILFFGERQQEAHYQMQENSLMGILQSNDKVDDLLDVKASLNATSLYRPLSANDQRLLRLVRFKAFRVAIDETASSFDESRIRDCIGDPPAPSNRILLDNRCYLSGDENELEYQPARTWATYLETTPVWVDWRYYEPARRQAQPPSYVQSQISKLATLLRDGQKPDEFRVPDCLGYIHEAHNLRFGFVFHGAGNFPPPSLFDMITSSSRPRPSLTTRIQIARAVATSVWYLHATNWLHKGLRSDNVVFLFRPPAPPYLSGFDYSRPANAREATEQPAQNKYRDLYRHPAAQFDVPRDGRDGFKKAYDIYSLGVVLFEIGMWKPIHEIVGIDIAEGLRAAEIKDTQTRLLSQELLMNLAADVGDAYMAMVASCLSGDFGFDSFDGQGDQQGTFEARLQLEFGERVVRKLDSIAV
ncbi:unnamed protein product [Discula destructiva]